MRSDLDRLRDILEAIDRIGRRTRKGRASLDDELVQVWVVHNLEVLGEAARGISGAVRERYPDVPWRGMIGMRDVLGHGYFAVDVERVWGTISSDLPDLRQRLASILERERGSDR